MKTIKLTAAAVLALSTIATPSFAGQPYVSASYSAMSVDTSVFGQTSTADISSINLTGGYKFSNYIALEGFYSLGTSQDSFNRDLGDDFIGSSGFEIELENGFGINLVGTYPINESFALFSKLGFATLSFDDTDGDPAGADGVSFGIGGKYSYDNNHSLFLEYTSFTDGEYDDFDIDVDPSALTAGYSFTF